LVKFFSTSIVSNSSSALNFFFGEQWKSDNRYRVIDNGICLNEIQKADKSFIRRELGIPESAFVVGHSGRLDCKKNHRAILKVAQSLVKSESDIYFILTGKGTRKLEDEILQSGLQSTVFALDFRTDMASILKEFDVFYFPSYTEGQSNALIEAMIAGVPVIASDIEGNREAIPSFISNFLVDADDTVGASNLITALKNNIRIYPSVEVKEWAMRRYDSDEKFTEFYSVLTAH
jgi:glycosyltransferase involved in cell wall biosynthesis